MSIKLTKGGNINLSKKVPGLSKIRVALGWHVNSTDTGYDFDLDVSAFLLKHHVSPVGVKPQLLSENHLVFYNNLVSPDGAITHSGDNRTGSAEIDDEVIFVDLNAVEPNISEVSFVVTIHEAIERRQNFGQVKNAYIRLVDEEKFQKLQANLLGVSTRTLTSDEEATLLSEAEVARYDLTEEFSVETALQFGSLYKHDGDWKFKAVGAGYNKGLDAFIAEYGFSSHY